MAIFKQSAVPIAIEYNKPSIRLSAKVRLTQIIIAETTTGHTTTNKALLWQTRCSKGLLSISVLCGCLLLGACQTAPLSPATPSVTPSVKSPDASVTVDSESTVQRTIIIPSADELAQADSDYTIDEDSYANDDYSDDGYYSNDDYADDANDYTIEPYIPPAASNTTPSTPAPPNAAVNQSINPPVYETNTVPSATAPSNRDPVSSRLPPLPSHNDLLERARQNSQQQTRQATANSSSLPAFRNLMQVGISQLKAGQLTAAESSFTRAQRLAPKSSAVYFYLAQVALKKNQPRKAEAMARRGLVVSEDASRRHALWQIILKSGQAQNNTRVINEAKQALR